MSKEMKIRKAEQKKAVREMRNAGNDRLLRSVDASVEAAEPKYFFFSPNGTVAPLAL